MLRNKIKDFCMCVLLVVTGPYWILGLRRRMKRDFGIGFSEAVARGWFDDPDYDQWRNEAWKSLWVREE